MANGPDPTSDFVIEDETYSEGASYPTDDHGTDYPIGEHQAKSGVGGDGTTADKLEPAAEPLRVRFGVKTGDK